jgi:hypothetical protein
MDDSWLHGYACPHYNHSRTNDCETWPAVNAGTRFVCCYDNSELSGERKINNCIYGRTGKPWRLSVNTNNYGSIGKLWSLRDFFVSRSADVFIGRSAQKLNTNIYGCTGNRWSLGVNANNYGSIRKRWSLREFMEAVELVRLFCKSFGWRFYRSFGTENQYQYLRMHRKSVEFGCECQQLRKHTEAVELAPIYGSGGAWVWIPITTEA